MDKPQLPSPDDLRRLSQGLVQTPAFNLVFAQLRFDAFARWKATAPHDVATREQAWSEIRALDSIEAQLKTWSRTK